MPVDQFRRRSLVENLNSHRLAFCHAQRGPGNRTVIGDGFEDAARRDFHVQRPNPDGEVSLGGILGASGE